MFHVIDANSIIHRHAHAPGLNLTAPDGEPTKATFGFVRAMEEMRTAFRHEVTHVAVCFDGLKSALLKKAIDPDYKEGRAPHDPDIGTQLRRCRRLAKRMGYRVVKEDGWEADDAIATLVRRFSGKVAGFVIVTCDKDMMQLMSKSRNVRIYHPFERRMLAREDVEAKWGVPPRKVLEVMTLCGDMTDNVRGLAGCGPKTAGNWIRSFGTAAEACKQMAETNPKWAEKIKATDFAKVRKLMALLEDCPCPTDLDKYKNPGEIMSTDFRRALGKLGFNSFRKR